MYELAYIAKGAIICFTEFTYIRRKVRIISIIRNDKNLPTKIMKARMYKDKNIDIFDYKKE